MHLTRNQCSALRGLSILAIVLHNWTHWLPFAVKENEYTFSMRNVNRLCYELQHADGNIVIHLLSFFGHYGVPLFLFLSGYGLVRKYESTAQSQPAVSFIGTHFVKLFRMMVIGFAIFLVTDALLGQTPFSTRNLLAQLGMVNNLLPQPHRAIWPGPYWFFGLMLQLYIVYRLLLYRRADTIAIAFIIIAWLAQALLPIAEKDTLNYLRYNCIGSILPFALGILAGRHGIPHLNKTAAGITLLISTALIFAGSLTYQTWLWVPVAVITAGIALVVLLPGNILQPLTWTGVISAALFIIHPTLRRIFLPSQHTANAYTTLLIYLFTAVIAAWLLTPLLKPKRPNT